MTTRAVQGTIEQMRHLADEWHSSDDKDAIVAGYRLLEEDLERLGFWEDQPLPFHRVEGKQPEDQRIPINWSDILAGSEPHFI